MTRGSAAWSLLLVATAAGCATATDGARLGRALDALVATEALAGGRVGVVVADASTREVLAQHAADRGFATASNMKLLSSAVALQTLGPDFRAATTLLRRGEVHDGVLEGDLILRGEGDPTFGKDLADLDELVAAVRDAGIRRVAGRVVGDGSFLGDEVRGLGWQWDYLEADYAAPFGGLCMAGNVVTVRVRPDATADGGVRVDWSPRGGPAPLAALVAAAPGGGAHVTAKRALGSERIELTGSVAADAAEVVVEIAVHDPAAFAAAVLRSRLQSAGVDVDGAEVGPASVAATAELLRHRSPPLAEIVAPLLTRSDNLYAEQVWRLSGRHALGAGDTASAERQTKDFLAAIGIDPRGLVQADGSGLSRRNLVQPRQIAGLLLWMRDQPFRDAFVAGLPVAGVTGTLRNRFQDGRAKGRVRAKTGFISRVVCLSGYVPRPDPAAAPLVFCVMLNDFTCDTDVAKAAVDRFVEELMAVAGW